MGRFSNTKDEKFLITIYEIAQCKGNFFSTITNTEICMKLQKEKKTVHNMIKYLLQSNFLKKINKETVKLTENGKQLAQSLFENR